MLHSFPRELVNVKVYQLDIVFIIKSFLALWSLPTFIESIKKIMSLKIIGRKSIIVVCNFNDIQNVE